MKVWGLLVLLAAVFGLVGLGLVAGGLAAGELVLVGVGAPFVLVGALLAAGVPRVRAEHAGDEGDLAIVSPGTTPPSSTPSSTPWSLDEVAAEIARVLEPTPFVVEAGGGWLRVRADLADARFLTVVGARRVVEVRTLDLVPVGEARAVLRDTSRSASWTGGVGRSGLRLQASAAVFSGRLWSHERSIELGVGRDGAGAPVDYRFSSAEMREPVRAVLDRAGWRVAQPAETLVALGMAGLGASAVVVVPLAFLVIWLLDR